MTGESVWQPTILKRSTSLALFPIVNAIIVEKLRVK